MRSAPVALPVVLRGPLLIVAALAAVAVVVLGAMHFGDSSLSGVDAAILPSIDGVGGPWHYVALVFDFGGEPIGSTILVAAVVLGTAAFRRYRTTVLTLAGVLITVGVTTVLKPVVGRKIHEDFLSYPSGHTALATALALILAFLVVGKMTLSRVPAVLVVLGFALAGGLAMGWAEVALGAHYPTDAAGGFCAALVVVPATAWLVDRVSV